MPGTQLVQSLIRGLNLLQLVADAEHGLSLHQLSELTGLKPPTVHNLARTLVVRGFLTRRGATPMYVLGPELFQLISQHHRRDLLSRAAKLVQRLAHRYDGATATYSESLELEVVIRLRATSERPMVLERPEGRFMHPYNNVTSLVFQAYWPPEQCRAYRRRYPLVEYGGTQWESEEQLDKTLADIRRTGYMQSEAQDEAVLMAAPVFGGGKDIIGALGLRVQKPVDQSKLDESVQGLVGGAADLSSTIQE